MKVVMVSTYPPNPGGVARYTQFLISHLRQQGIQVLVLTKKTDGKIESRNDFLMECWDGKIYFPFQIFRWIRKLKPDLVHVQHEYTLYGGTLAALAFPVLLVFIKLLKIPCIVTIHSVIKTSDIDKKFLKENGYNIPAFLFKLGLRILLKMIDWFSEKIITHERYLADGLITSYKFDNKKIRVIPHGIEIKDLPPERQNMKKILGLENKKVILFFGLVAKYKGIETLMEGFSEFALKHDDSILIIAGGQHPRLKNEHSYLMFIDALKQKANSVTNDKIWFKDFISEEEIDRYFSAADIVVVPHYYAIASYALVAFAAQYGNAIVVSEGSKVDTILGIKSVTYSTYSGKDLSMKLEELFSNQQLKDHIIEIVKKVGRSRDWYNVATATMDVYRKALGLRSSPELPHTIEI